MKREREQIKEGGGEVTTREAEPWALTDRLTDTHHFSELITPQVQPLQLREFMHAPVDTKDRQGVRCKTNKSNIYIIKHDYSDGQA